MGNSNNFHIKRLHAQLSLKKTVRRKKKNSFYSEMANMKLIFLFSVVIAIGLSSGFDLGKNQKEKSALKKLKSMHPMMLVKRRAPNSSRSLNVKVLLPWELPGFLVFTRLSTMGMTPTTTWRDQRGTSLHWHEPTQHDFPPIDT